MIQSVAVAFQATAAGPVVPAVLEAALEAWPLPTGPSGDMSQMTQATLTADVPSLSGIVATRTLTLSWPTTAVAAAVPLSGPVKTAVALAIAPGLQTVTPASMTNIVPNGLLTIDAANPSLTEVVQVVSITPTSFTATFANAHAAQALVTGNGSQVVMPASMALIFGPVNTVIQAPIGVGVNVITPNSMKNIEVGVPLVIDDTTPGLQETVVPSAVAATTFTATFVNAHGPNANVTRPGSDLQVDFLPYATTVAAAVAVGTFAVAPVALGPIAKGMLLRIDAGTATQEDVRVQAIDATNATFTAKFQFAHAPGFPVVTLSSQPGTNPENVTVSAITATTFTAVFQFAHMGGFNVGGIVNAMFPQFGAPGTPAPTVAAAFRNLYQPVLAQALSTKVTAVEPVVTVV